MYVCITYHYQHTGSLSYSIPLLPRQAGQLVAALDPLCLWQAASSDWQDGLQKCWARITSKARCITASPSKLKKNAAFFPYSVSISRK